MHKKHNTTCVGHNYAQTNTTQYVSDTTMHKKPQHNMFRTPLCTKNTTQHLSDTTIHKNTTQNVSDTPMQKKHNTTCVGHNYAQKTQHNMCWTQLYTNKHQ